jgi:dienelactone hydrolase
MRRIFLVSLLALSLIACGTNNAALEDDQTPRSRYTGAVGESPVGVIPEGSLRDATRNRDIGVAVDYPTRSGPHPLIIFSHGFGSTAREYIGLASYWASQGYVVIRPTHADAGKGATARGAQDAWATQGAADWAGRVQDVRFLIDSLDQLEQRYPELQGKMDRARIGVGGHSYGAMTAMLIGGGRTFPGGTTAYADPRVRAIVAMGTPGPGPSRGLTNESFAQLTKPTLFIVGTRETGVDETETPAWRRQAFELAPAGDKWLVTLEGGTFSAYTGRIDPALQPDRRATDRPIMEDPNDPNRNPVAPPVVRQQEPRRPAREGTPGLRTRGAFATVKALSLAFWDTYLRDDRAEARTALEAAGTRGGVTLEKK